MVEPLIKHSSTKIKAVWKQRLIFEVTLKGLKSVMFSSKLFRSLVAVAFLFVKSYPINNQNFEAASQENFLEGCLFK